ncbi:MAG: quinolinate synthase NadA [Candidatus Hodarchaeota archaeon]
MAKSNIVLSDEEIQAETDRLFEKMQIHKWTREECANIAPLTLEINKLKKVKNAVILAHSYQTSQIIFGIGDFAGDSYGLSKEAMNIDANLIVFCGVVFMAETAKLLNPDKTVLIPSTEAGCSLADGITPDDVRQLKKKHPGIPVVCYVNTTAAVKAECDVCITSANAVEVVKKLDSDAVIFLPDKHMVKNLESLTGKKLIGWNAECIVHDQFTPEQVKTIRERYEGIKILAHTECDPSVAALADLVGGTGDMIRYVQNSDAKDFALITECGLADRLRIEFPDKNFFGSCILCPYMKKINLENTLQVLVEPFPEQVIEIPDEISVHARKCLDRMFELTS